MRRLTAVLLLLGVGCGAEDVAQDPRGAIASALRSSVIVDLGTLPGHDVSRATNINDRGVVVGWSQPAGGGATPRRGFRWTCRGGLEDLGDHKPQDHYTPMDVNNRGVITGVMREVDGSSRRAFLWEDGVFTDLGTFGTGNFSEGNGINDRDQVAGTFNTTPGGDPHAFVWEAGFFTDLGVIPGGTRSFAAEINDAGVVVGHGNTAPPEAHDHAFRWVAGAGTDLGVPDGTPDSIAFDVNNRGSIVGWSPNAPERGWVWKPESGFELLARLPGGFFTKAVGIQKAGHIVGWADDGDAAIHATIWEGGGLPLDLNDVLPPGSGWELTEATAINGHEQIVGQGNIGGERHAFLLTQKSFLRCPRPVLPPPTD